MANTLTTVHDVLVLVCAPDGAKLKSERDALDLIGGAMSSGAELILVPVERLAEDFFYLKTGLAGQIMQKCVTYRRRLVILGDISQPSLAVVRSETSCPKPTVAIRCGS